MSENEYGPREKKPVVVMVNINKVWGFIKRILKRKGVKR